MKYAGIPGIVCVSIMMLSVCAAKDIAGIALPDTLNAGDTTLKLHGAGIRKKLWIKVYAAGLYLPVAAEGQPILTDITADTVINADQPMAIRMHFVYDSVSREKLIDAWNDGFQKATGGASTSLAEAIETFNGYFKEALGPGDIVDIVYIPGTGTRVTIKGDDRGTIPGVPFKNAVFGIWLCDDPADASLKEGMLGL